MIGTALPRFPVRVESWRLWRSVFLQSAVSLARACLEDGFAHFLALLTAGRRYFWLY